ncbi:MAG TPA: hypothetical protein VGB41_02100 [Acidimicrobiia bacterium]
MTRYVTLAEYFWLGERVTGIDAGILAKASRSTTALGDTKHVRC